MSRTRLGKTTHSQFIEDYYDYRTSKEGDVFGLALAVVVVVAVITGLLLLLI